MPTIPYDENNRSLNTEDIVEEESNIKNVLSLPKIKFIGSDEGCGCGFRHALIDGENWFNAVDEEGTEFDNSNHQNLVKFIIENNKGEKTVEILSCWEGDHNEPVKFRETIKIHDLLSSDFYFKERGLYTVEL
jgi:hypothetical protein